MKMHMGVDDKLQLIGVIDITAVNALDIVSAGKLLHSQEQRDCGDSGYLGMEKPDEHKHSNSGSWYITKRPGAHNNLDAYQQKVEKNQSQYPC
nr:transposase [Halomonas sp. A3H3]